MLELARAEDFDTVNRIAAQVHDLHVSWRPDLYCHTDCLFPADYYAEAVGEKRLFVAKRDGTILGFVLFVIWETGGAGNVKRRVMSIDSIAVEESCRGQGIGREMMEGIRAVAKVRGCTDLQLSVYPQNDDAVSFYQKCGFTIRNINMQRNV